MMTALIPFARIRNRSVLASIVAGVFGAVSFDAMARDKHEVLVVTVENDMFTGSDSNYTNGMSINWSSDDLSLYEDNTFLGTWAGLFDFAPGFDADGEENFVIFSLIHEMNTPSDISVEDPPLFEQPYSGILLVDTSLITLHSEWQQSWNMRIGAVGPVTQADHMQVEYHELIGADQPLGWDTQLPNEPILNIGYLRSDRLLEAGVGENSGWRVSSIMQAELGNYSTLLGGGAIFEFGSGLRDRIATSSVGAGLGSFLGAGAEPTEQLEWSGYAGTMVYAVGHYLPLDGTVFRESRSLDYEPFAGFAGVGVSARYKNLLVNVGASFGSTFDEDSALLDVGSITVGWVF